MNHTPEQADPTPVAVEQVDRDAFHTLPFNADSVDIIYLLARHRLLGIEQGRAEMREEAAMVADERAETDDGEYEHGWEAAECIASDIRAIPTAKERG